MDVSYLPWNKPASQAALSCLRDDNIELTYRQFARRVDGVAAQLEQAGVRGGDVVAIMLPNRVELVLAVFAAWRLGAAATPVNLAFTAREADYQFKDSAPASSSTSIAISRRRAPGPSSRRHQQRRGHCRTATGHGARRQPGAARLHQWLDRQTQGRHAQPRQSAGNDRHDGRTPPAHQLCWRAYPRPYCQPTPTHPLVVRSCTPNTITNDDAHTLNERVRQHATSGKGVAPLSTQHLTVEIDTGSASSRGRPSDHAWMVRLRRADGSVIVAVGLSRTAAEHLADHIAEIVHDDRADEEVTPLA
jgi:hypothetical protein